MDVYYCNYNIIKCNDYNSEEEIVRSIKELLINDGPILLELRCKKGARTDLIQKISNNVEEFLQ